MKQKSHILSTDSDLESSDTSSNCGKEPASGRPFKKKGNDLQKVTFIA